MPNHSIITTFTLVKFLLSLVAFTEVSVAVYTHEKFTLVSKLRYRSKTLKCKHGISLKDGFNLDSNVGAQNLHLFLDGVS